MARNRIIYQSEALYVSKNINSTGSGEHFQLRRIQSANYNFSIDRKDVNQFGQLARIDSLVLKSPTVALDFSYYPTDALNEKALGFYVGTGTGTQYVEGNFASGQMGSSQGQNFYIITTDEGADLNTAGTGVSALGGKNAIGIGNGYLTNYTFDASVGNLPTVKISIEALNMQSASITTTGRVSATIIGTGNIVSVPSIDPILGVSNYLTGTIPSPTEATGLGGSALTSALRPGDLTLSFDSYVGELVIGAPLVDLSSINIQSASLSLPLSRTPLERLGSRFAYARVVDFPIVASLNVSAIVSDTVYRNLANIIDDATKRTISLNIKKPGSQSAAMVYTFKGSQLKSQSYSSSIGSNKTVDLVFQTQIGGPSDTNNGIYVSGTYSVIDSTIAGVTGDWAY